MLAGALEIQMFASMARLVKDMNEANRVVAGSMRKIEGAVSTAKRALGALGIGIGAVAFARVVSGALDTQDALQKMSQKVNETVENLVGLKHAFELGGVQMDAVQKGLGTLASQMLDASMGLAEAKRNFAALGIQIMNTDGTMKSTTTVLLEMSDQMKKTGESTSNMALAKKLLGKAGLEMIPTLRGGSDEMRRMMEEGQRLYPVTAENARQAEILNDNLMILGKEIKAGGIRKMNELVPGINEVTEAMKVAAKEAGLLTAAWVGLGGVMAMLLGKTGAQQEAKHLEDIANKIAEVKKQLAQGFIIPGRFFTPEAQAKLIAQLELLEAERARIAGIGAAKEEAARAEAAKKAKAAADLAARAKAAEEADKAAKEIAAREKKLKAEDIKGWIAHADAVFAAADEENLELAKLADEHWKNEEKLRDEDIKGWIAYADAVFAEADENNLELARINGEYWKKVEDARNKENEERLREQKRVSDEIDRMLGDAIMRGFERGEDAAKNFRDTLVNMFKTLVLRPIISAVLSPVTGAVGSALGGSMFSSGANAAGSMAGAGLVGSVGGWLGSAAAGGVPVTSTIGAVMSGAGYAGAGSTGMMGTLAAIPGWGWAALGAAAVGAYLLSDEGDAMRRGNWVAGFGQAGGSTQNKWFDASTGAGTFAAELAASEQQIASLLKLSADQKSTINSALDTLSGKQYGFGMERTDWMQSGAPQAIAADRLRVIADSLGVSLEGLANSMALAQREIDIAPAKLQLEIDLMKLQGKETEALAAERKRELDALDPMLHALQKQVYAAQDLAVAANDAGDAVSRLADLLSETQSAVNEQIGQSRSAAQAARAAAESFKQIGTALADAVTAIRGGGKAGAAGRLNALFGVAMTGNAAALSALPQAGQDFLAASLSTARTSLDFARDQAKVVAMLTQAQTVSAGLVNWNEYQATLLELQTGVLEAIRDQLALPSPDAVILRDQAALLATIGVLLKDQTGVILTGNAVQDVIRDINALGTTYSEQQLAALVASGGVQSDSLTALVTGNAMTVSLLQQLVAMQGAAAMAAYDAKFQEAVGTIWAAVQAAGGTLGDFDAQFAAWKAANPMPSYAVGTNFVQQTGPAIVHRGERITSVAANDELVTEIRSLRAEVASMRKDTRKSADTLEAVANGQLAFSTEAA